METIAISKFKATCLALLERVRRTGNPILVTRRGVPVAQVLPPPPAEPSGAGAYGCMAGTAEQLGDIVEPLPAQEWEALR
jgi:prevent-host-death family protein